MSILVILTLILCVSAVSAENNDTCDDAVVIEQSDNEILAVDSNGTADDSDSNSSSASDEETNSTVPVKQNSTIEVKKVVTYTTFKSEFSATLMSNGTPLASKLLTFKINGKEYTRTTDNMGFASVKLTFDKNASYKVKVSYAGDDSTNPADASAKWVIKNSKKTRIFCADKDINYRQGSNCAVIVRVLDENSDPVKNRNVTFKVNGKKYIAKTDSKGYAKILVSLKKGKYKVKYAFSKNAPFLSSSGSHKIKVKSPIGKGNGYWVWSSHMKSVNLKSIAKRGCKQIFLHVHSISVYGKSSVVSFINKAHKYGMKVHLWMQVFFEGNVWTRPVNKDGSYQYSFMNKKISQAKSYAKIKGVDGVHMDYVRFGGTAHLYSTSVDAVNYFVKKATLAIHKVKPNCIVSVAVMPEPSMMHYYYGQDIPTISKYVDVILPMVYKGNYGKNTQWIKSVTKTFVGESNGAQIWTGLQAYKSDSNPKKLTQSELKKDAKAAKAGGATGVILFRWGITCNFKFNKVF